MLSMVRATSQETTTESEQRTEVDQRQESQWAYVFPVDVSTQAKSLIFVKKLVAVGISTITYLRMIFPEIAYKDKYVEGLNLKILMDQSMCSASNLLISWVYGSFEAIEKQYLREMIFLVYLDKNDPDSLLERFTFKFSYTENGEVSLNHTFEQKSESDAPKKYEVKMSTFKMIRTIIMLMQNLDPLPPKVYLSMKLYYYNTRTPPGYVPSGFRPNYNDKPIHFSQKSINLKVGEVMTGFHSVKLRAAFGESQLMAPETKSPVNLSDGQVTKGADERGDEGEKDAHLGEDTAVGEGAVAPASIIDLPVVRRFAKQRLLTMIRQSPGKDASDEMSSTKKLNVSISPFTQDSKDSRSDETDDRSGVPTPGKPKFDSPSATTPRTPNRPCVLSTRSSTCSVRSASIGLAPTLSTDFPVRCPCGVNRDDGLMILCCVCGNWQHGACYAILEESHAPTQHFCERCADPPSICTDPYLILLDQDQIKPTCLYRRALVILAYLDGKVSTAVLANRLGVDIVMGKKIVMKLTIEEVLKHGPSSGQELDKNILYEVIYPKYFSHDLKLKTSPENNHTWSQQTADHQVPSLRTLLDSVPSVAVLSENSPEASRKRSGLDQSVKNSPSDPPGKENPEMEKENKGTRTDSLRRRSKLARKTRQKTFDIDEGSDQDSTSGMTTRKRKKNSKTSLGI